MRYLGFGIAICGIWAGTAYAISNGGHPLISAAATVATLGVSWASAFWGEE